MVGGSCDRDDGLWSLLHCSDAVSSKSKNNKTPPVPTTINVVSVTILPACRLLARYLQALNHDTTFRVQRHCRVSSFHFLLLFVLFLLRKNGVVAVVVESHVGNLVSRIFFNLLLHDDCGRVDLLLMRYTITDNVVVVVIVVGLGSFHLPLALSTRHVIVS